MAKFTRVLVGHDGGEHAEDALELGKLIADRSGAELTLASVVPTPVGGSMVPALTADAYTELAEAARASVRAAAEEAGADSYELEQSSSASHGLQSVAERIGADLIVVGSGSRAKAGHTRAGRKARQLMSGGESAVAIAPDGFRSRPRIDRIGVGVDGSPESRGALAVAIDLSSDGTSIDLISVAASFADEWGRWGVTYPLAQMAEATREAADELLKETLEETPASLSPNPVLLEGAAPIRLAEATADLDLLCLGSRSYGPVLRVLLGSVSSDVVNHSTAAVLVVPRTDEAR